MKVKGYKVFNSDWTCRNKQYTCSGKFEENVAVQACNKGMHFCKKAIDCFNYYTFNNKNKVAEVIAYGDVVEEGDKCCTNRLEIIREISWAEMLELVNIGENCTGYCNSGNCNSGNYNSGYRNSGNCNSGNYNSGYRNSGNCNSGNYNSGDYNSGNCNSGDYNSGVFNSSIRNSGDYNSGNHNSGDFNSGSFNSGNYNSGNHNSGFFNTITPRITMFNKITNMTYEQFINSRANILLLKMPKELEWVCFDDMTEEEKQTHPKAKIANGYLKKFENYIEIVNNWWQHLNKEEKEIIMSLPNFDRDIFKEITGINILM